MIKNLFNIGGIFLLALVFLLYAPMSYAEDPPLPTPVGRVVWVQGSLKAVMPNNEVRLLQKTSIIYLNDTLITDATSSAQIIFSDNTQMTFRPETKFYIDKYQYEPKSGKKSVGKYIMNLIEGGFRTITGLIAKSNPNDYSVNTPVATIGVRGTDYSVYYGKDKQLFVGYYSGTPCINNLEGSLCLSEKVKFASVPQAGVAPKAVSESEVPAMLKEKLPISPAKISPFSSVGGGIPQNLQSPNNLGTSGTRGEIKGPITSFCITN